MRLQAHLMMFCIAIAPCAWTMNGDNHVNPKFSWWEHINKITEEFQQRKVNLLEPKSTERPKCLWYGLRRIKLMIYIEREEILSTNGNDFHFIFAEIDDNRGTLSTEKEMIIDLFNIVNNIKTNAAVPLHAIKRLERSEDIVEFEIYLIDKYGMRKIDLPAASYIAHYLFSDHYSENRGRLSFFLNTFFNWNRYIDSSAIKDPLKVLNQQTDIRKGDWIVLFYDENNKRKLEQYAFSLGEGLFLQQFDNGALVIMRLEEMLKLTRCMGFARIKSNACRKTFEEYGLASYDL